MLYYLTFILVLVVPLSQLAIGLRWRSKPPKREGSGFAYRTELSARSEDTWAYAHRHISRLWIRQGLMVSVATIVLMILFRAHYSSFFLWLIGGQMAFLCVSVFLIDNLLKAGFDEDGNPLI